MRALLYVLFGVVFALAVPSAFAKETPDAGPRFSNRGGAPAVEPPWWRDEVHVPNGCHLSSLRYVARFSATYAERAEVFVLGPRHARRHHTIALVTWSGSWWARDEYLGVFPVGVPASREVTASGFARQVHKAYDQHRQSIRRSALRSAPTSRSNSSYERRLADVQRAARIVPGPTEVYSIIGHRERVPLLAFAPEPGWIAVYDPTRGTALLQCAAIDIAKSVHAIARHLGYLGDRVTRHPAGPVESRPPSPTPVRGEAPAGVLASVVESHRAEGDEGVERNPQVAARELACVDCRPSIGSES